MNNPNISISTLFFFLANGFHLYKKSAKNEFGGADIFKAIRD